MNEVKIKTESIDNRDIEILFNEVNLAPFCRAATVRMSVDGINHATLDVVGVVPDVIAELKCVRVIYVCEHCKAEHPTQGGTVFGDIVRKEIPA